MPSLTHNIEVTTTQDVPIYFPQRKKRKKRPSEGKKMNEATFAVSLVEEFGLSHRDALEVVLEQDDDDKADKAAKKMAKKAANGDKDKEKELEAKYKEQIKKKMNGKDKDEQDDDDDDDDDMKKKKKNGKENEGRRKKY